MQCASWALGLRGGMSHGSIQGSNDGALQAMYSPQAAFLITVVYVGYNSSQASSFNFGIF